MTLTLGEHVVYKLPRVVPLFAIDARNISPRQTSINHFDIQMTFVEHSLLDSQTDRQTEREREREREFLDKISH